MRYHHWRRPSKARVFGLLMLGSAALVLLPQGLFRPARNMTQLMAVAGWPARESSQRLAGHIEQLGSQPVPAGQHQQTVREKLALENENSALRQQVSELQETIAALSRIRQQGFPAGGRLIPARVIASDAAIGRDSMVLWKGATAGIKSGDWVASRLLIQAGSEAGVRDQLAVLNHECLLGWVEQAAPLTARVVLLSDRMANKSMPVRIVPRDRKRPPLTSGNKPLDFALEGAGQGRMRIPDIPRDFCEGGRVRVGDLVTSSPTNPRLPMSLVIGEIRELVRLKDKPLYYRATVLPPYEPRSLNQVFVVDLSPAAAAPPERAVVP